MPEQRKHTQSDWLETISIALALLFIVWFVINAMLGSAKRSVVYFAPAESFTVTAAAPGEWSVMTLPIKKKRDCELTDGSQLVLTYATQDRPQATEWTRDGPYLAPSREWQEGRLTFRVPVTAPPGIAYAIFEAEFECNIGRVRHRSPAAKFIISEPLAESGE